MKTLESILNSPERRLSAEEMKEIKGGADYICQCNDGSALWYGSYASAERAAYWCEGGGSCIITEEMIQE